jgi:hypothetical protein
VLAISGDLGDEHVVDELTRRLQSTGRVSERQLAWLLATALPTLRAVSWPSSAERRRRPPRAGRLARCSRASAIRAAVISVMTVACTASAGTGAAQSVARGIRCGPPYSSGPSAVVTDRTSARSDQASNLVICNRHRRGPCRCTCLVLPAAATFRRNRASQGGSTCETSLRCFCPQDWFCVH